MKNAVIADLFDQMADIMEIKGENAFRVNSYRKVARILRDLSEDIEHVAAEERLTEIAGIGEGSAEKIGQFLETGRIEAHDELMADFPAGALDLLRIPGLGPKTVSQAAQPEGRRQHRRAGEGHRGGRAGGHARHGRRRASRT